MTAHSGPRRPYPGLRPYREDERDQFFGRDRERDILLDLILTNDLTLLFAASGAGKSSILQAALIPHLKDPARENLDVIYYNDWVIDPLVGLKGSLRDDLKVTAGLRDTADAAWSGMSLHELLRFCISFVRQPLVLILDQFEEFFQYHRGEKYFRSFIAQLTQVITDRDLAIATVISMREDFALELNAFKPQLPTILFDNFYRLEALSRDGARDAIVEPVKHFGYVYESALLDRLVTDLSARRGDGQRLRPGREVEDMIEPPHLQIVCEQLWLLEKESPKKELRLATYKARGGSVGLLRSYLNDVLDEYPRDDQRLASVVFTHLVSRRGTKIAYTAEKLAKVAGERDEDALGDVLGALAEARILRSVQREDVSANLGGVRNRKLTWYELYHDLFTQSVDAWNEKFRAEERRRQMAKMAFQILVFGVLAFVVLDVLLNHGGRFFRLSQSGVQDDRIELYRGKPTFPDLLRRTDFLAETPFRRFQLEPDKRFLKRIFSDKSRLYPELIDRLSQLDRMEAYGASGLFGDALGPVKEALGDNDVRFGLEVLRRIGEIRAPITVSRLTKLVREHGDGPLLIDTVNLLADFGTTYAMEQLASLRTHEEAPVRQAVARALGRTRDPRAVEMQGRLLLEDTSAPTAVAVAESLGDLGLYGIRESVARLAELAGDDRPRVAAAAAEALGRCALEQAVEPLIQRLEVADNPGVLIAVLDALRRHSAKGRRVEIRARRLAELIRDARGEVARAAIRAARYQDSEEVVAALVRSLAGGSSEIVKASARALAVIERRAGAVTRTGLVSSLILIPGLRDVESRAAVSEMAAEISYRGLVDAVSDILRHEGRTPDRSLVHVLARSCTPGMVAAWTAIPNIGRALTLSGSSWRRVDGAFILACEGAPVARLVAESLLNSDRDWRSFESLWNRAARPTAIAKQVFLELAGPRFVEAATAGRVLLKFGEQDDRRWLVQRARVGDEVAYVGLAIAFRAGTIGLQDEMTALVEGWDRIDPQAQRFIVRNDGRPVSGLNLGGGSEIEMLGLPTELLARALRSRDQVIREGAAKLWPNAGGRGTHEVLLDVVKAAASETRLAAIAALGRDGAQSAREALHELVLDSDVESRVAAAAAIAQYKLTDGLRYLRGISKSTNAEATIAVVKALEGIGRPEVVPLLVELLQHRSHSVRARSARALGSVGDRKATKPLRALLQDRDRRIRVAAAHALAELGDARGAPELIGLLAYRGVDEHRTARMLGRLRSAPAHRVLAQYVATLIDEIAPADRRARYWLSEVKERSKQIDEGLEALDMLGGVARRFGLAAARPELRLKGALRMLRTGEWSGRRAATVELGAAGDATFFPELVEILMDRYGGVRSAVALALGEIGEPSAIAALRGRVDEEHNRRSLAVVVRALLRLGDFTSVGAKAVRQGSRIFSVLADAVAPLDPEVSCAALHAMLIDPTVLLRREAARVFAKLGCEPDWAVLSTQLDRERDSLTKRHLRQTCVQLGHVCGLQHVRMRYSSLDVQGRARTAWSLRGSHRRDLLDLLDRAYRQDLSGAVRLLAGLSLMRDGDRVSVVDLERLAESMTRGDMDVLAALLVRAISEGRARLLWTDNGRRVLGRLLTSKSNPEAARRLGEAIGQAGAKEVLPLLYQLQAHWNVEVQETVAVAFRELCRAASPVLPDLAKLRKVATSTTQSVVARFVYVDALAQLVKQDEAAVDVLLELVERSEKELGTVIYQRLAELSGRRDLTVALERLRKIFNAHERANADWRRLRDDAEEQSSSGEISGELQAGLEEAEHKRPDPTLTAELAYALAALETDEKKRIELLRHPLAAVREGAIFAIADSSSPKQIGTIAASYARTSEPIFRKSLYRVADVALQRFARDAARDATNLEEAELKKLHGRLGLETSIGERVAWTVDFLETARRRQAAVAP